MKCIGFMVILLLIFACRSKSFEEGCEVVVYDPLRACSFEEIMDLVDFIPLEAEDLMLDGLAEIYMDEESIFVIDKTLRKTIYHFDRAGKYRNQIGSTGRAGHEYLDLSDFMFSGDSVLVFDAQTQKVFKITTPYLFDFGECNIPDEF